MMGKIRCEHELEKLDEVETDRQVTTTWVCKHCGRLERTIKDWIANGEGVIDKTLPSIARKAGESTLAIRLKTDRWIYEEYYIEPDMSPAFSRHSSYKA